MRQVGGPNESDVVRKAMVPIEVVIIGDHAQDPHIPSETQGGIAQVLFPERCGPPEQEHVDRDLEHVGEDPDHGSTDAHDQAREAFFQIEQVLRPEVLDNDQCNEDRIDVLTSDVLDLQGWQLGLHVQPRLYWIESHVSLYFVLSCSAKGTFGQNTQEGRKGIPFIGIRDEFPQSYRVLISLWCDPLNSRPSHRTADGRG